MMSVWTWILVERERSWSLSLQTSSRQCHVNPVLVYIHKPPDPVVDIYEGHTYDLKTVVDIQTRTDVVPVDYLNFSQTFHLMKYLFQFITGINSRWDCVMWRIVALLAWIGILTRLSIYRVPIDPVRWSCEGFGYLL